MTAPDPAEAAPRSPLQEMLVLVALVFALIFCLGAVVGFFGAAGDSTPGFGAFAVGGVLVLITAVCAWQVLVRTQRLLRRDGGKVGPSVRKSRSLWAFCIGLGFVIGLAVPLIQDEAAVQGANAFTADLFSAAPISPGAAVALLIAVALIAAASVLLYRYMDEHERAAQEYASLVALNLYALVTIGWGIAAKGGLAPAVDHAVIFLAVMLCWMAVWLWRRYR